MKGRRCQIHLWLLANTLSLAPQMGEAPLCNLKEGTWCSLSRQIFGGGGCVVCNWGAWGWGESAVGGGRSLRRAERQCSGSGIAKVPKILCTSKLHAMLSSQTDLKGNAGLLVMRCSHILPRATSLVGTLPPRRMPLSFRRLCNMKGAMARLWFSLLKAHQKHHATVPLSS